MANQVYALVRHGDLTAIKIGGRGQWRVERDKLEEYIERVYAETLAFISAHPIQEDTPPELGMDEARNQLASDGATKPKAEDTAQPAAKRPGASGPGSMPTPSGEARSRPASWLNELTRTLMTTPRSPGPPSPA